MIRDNIIAILCWATLAVGSSIANAVLGGLILSILHRVAPDLAEVMIWKALAGLASLTSPVWVLLVLEWIRADQAAEQA